MERDFTQEQKYIQAKKRVGKIKGFYWHLISYITINTIISVVIIVGLMNNDKFTIIKALSNFKVYVVWFFWGISLFFHWLGTFGTNIFFTKDWEQRKIQKYLDEAKK